MASNANPHPAAADSATDARIVVRPAALADVEAIVDMQLAMALETEGLVLDRALVTEGARAPFHNPELAQYYVAEAAGAAQGETVVGMLMVTFEWSDWRNGKVLWIQSVFTRSEYRRRGVFTALYAAVKARAETDPGVCGIRLYVERENARAQRTYQALGMEEEHYNMMKWMKGQY